jgi:hypothetical protein
MRRMLSLLLVLVTAQVPAVPGEGSLISSCKQRIASACEALRQVNPQRAAQIERETLRLAEEAAEAAAAAAEATEGADAVADAAPEPPDCKGQDHHIISRPIAQALKNHKTLRGLYKPRDKRFVAQAKDEESHCGYQKWHRDVDQEVIEWLTDHPDATPDAFMELLRNIYRRKEMLERFPRGF